MTSCAGFFFFLHFSFFKSRKSLLHISCLLYFYAGSFSYTSHHAGFSFFNLGSFSYTSRAGIIFIWGVSLTHPVLASFLSGEFSYTSHASFIFLWGVSLTHPMLASFLCGEFPHILCWLLFFYLVSFSYTSCTGFLNLSWEFFLHIPSVLALFLYGEFPLHMASSPLIWGVFITHPVLPSFLYRQFVLHVACWHNRRQ